MRLVVLLFAGLSLTAWAEAAPVWLACDITREIDDSMGKASVRDRMVYFQVDAEQNLVKYYLEEDKTLRSLDYYHALEAGTLRIQHDEESITWEGKWAETRVRGSIDRLSLTIRWQLRTGWSFISAQGRCTIVKPKSVEGAKL